ncbi:hypothetical protein [Streptococcus loxodontisalivarius]|uniref:Uncharacterized protein n=1 Tax=Streptococcus loxodontisalivarius TaxID=1349415 RepID=A0ABS2PTT1_9STRE|nr:hypothetical protein [Streptococcus loxodontisalivarius]MBM7643331.1 hypothetical protein [Streptococcus loxodontisalivarius]
MAKWAGFFLSEHNSSLDHFHKPSLSKSLESNELIDLLMRLYSSQEMVKIVLGEDKVYETLSGKIVELEKEGILFKSENSYRFIPFLQIFSLEPAFDKNL